MGAARELVQQAYEAWVRGEVAAILELVADEVDWEFVASADVPYGRRRTTRNEVAAFFADIPRADQIHEFEPLEFIEAGDHVTVLAWERSTARDTGTTFESDWIHIFTVRGRKITPPHAMAYHRTAGRRSLSNRVAPRE